MLKFHAEHNHWVPGVPARDLTDAEVDLYGGREFLLKTGCYIDDQTGESDNPPASNGKTAKKSSKGA